MVEKSLAVLIAARVDDVLVLRRLLRDTSWRVDGATSATQSLRAITKTQYAAVVADDEQIVGLEGAKLLSHCEELQPHALRLLIARRERRPELANDALSGRYQLFVRPYFAAPVRDALAAHERAVLASARRRAASRVERSPGRGRRREEEAADDEVEVEGEHDVTDPAGGPHGIIEAETKPYAVTGAVAQAGAAGPTPAAARRRLLATMAELAETTLGHGVGHAERVGQMARALGAAIGLSPGDLEALDEAALLHDVGELTAGLDLVKAPRRLTANEFREVARHAEASFQVAVKCGAARQALMAIRHHHERFDGRGYPRRLAGKQIPVTARVLAVADTFDALATGRPYRGRQSMHQCIKTLRQAAGVQLDPALVDLFLKRRVYESVDWLAMAPHEPHDEEAEAASPPRKKARAG